MDVWTWFAGKKLQTNVWKIRKINWASSSLQNWLNAVSYLVFQHFDSQLVKNSILEKVICHQIPIQTLSLLTAKTVIRSVTYMLHKVRGLIKDKVLVKLTGCEQNFSRLLQYFKDQSLLSFNFVLWTKQVIYLLQFVKPNWLACDHCLSSNWPLSSMLSQFLILPKPLCLSIGVR